MKTDLEIARAAKMRPVAELAAEWFGGSGLGADDICPHGHFKAKLPADLPQRFAKQPDGKLILVTAITPTPAGEGKTTTSVGLADALNRIGKKTAVALREPSLGPVFGMKGGAAGGGFAQVVPMEDINLHFTGDFAAIGLAHNLLSALVDNHMHHGNELGLDSRRVAWRRVVDMNDRALRNIVVGLGGPGNGFSRADGFDIVVASEIMAILCLADSLADLKRRVSKITVGQTRDKRPVLAGELQAAGAMTALLKDAIRPNLGADIGEHAGVYSRGAFRKHRAWVQLGFGDADGFEVVRLCGDGGGFRRGLGGGKVCGYQVPQERVEGGRGGFGCDDSGAEVSRRGGAGKVGGGESGRVEGGV